MFLLLQYKSLNTFYGSMYITEIKHSETIDQL